MNDTVRNENVIAALRLAKASCGDDDYERFGRIAERILAEAAPTMLESRGGVELLLGLHRSGELRFEVNVNV